MHVLIAVVAAAAAAATALARPPLGVKMQRAPEPVADPIQVRARPPPPVSFGEYMLPRYILPHFLGLQEGARLPPPPKPPSPMHYDWLTREIDRLSLMDFEETPENFDPDPPDRRVDPDADNIYEPSNIFIPSIPDIPNNPHAQPNEELDDHEKPEVFDRDVFKSELLTKVKKENVRNINEFALKPKDEGYFEVIEQSPAFDVEKKQIPVVPTLAPKAKMEIADAAMIFEEPRKTRQNPTLSKTKTLIADNLDRLRTGMHEENDLGTDTPGHIHLSERIPDSIDSIYIVAIIAAAGAALTVAVAGLGFGWYTLSKKAKAAADVDYPAYGVTGPIIDMSSADKKLAHSAHMYHYQHQKQQILAMERNGMENRNGSVSDPDSEEENEEGDYTVYECPGFATTGDMEVKNPMFSDDPTPATPGKIELVKPQPKK